jgi:hypothetical protein
MDLEGVWELTDWRRIDAEGRVSFPHSEDGLGRIIYSGGHVSVLLMSPSETAGQHTFLAYSGRYDRDGEQVHHYVDLASDRRLLGQVLSRRIEVAPGGVIRLRTLNNVASEDQDSHHVLSWRRGARTRDGSDARLRASEDRGRAITARSDS